MRQDAKIGIDHITIRLARAADAPALARLASLDAGVLLDGPTLVAECDGELVAAFPLEGGRPLADPFRPTAAVVGLLALRARQLGAPVRKRPGLRVPWHRQAAPSPTA